MFTRCSIPDLRSKAFYAPPGMLLYMYCTYRLPSTIGDRVSYCCDFWFMCGSYVDYCLLYWVVTQHLSVLIDI